jgi:hypothetical protein
MACDAARHLAGKSARQSLAHPESIGWWAICGDLPTDYISSADVTRPQHPRKAMQVFAKNWLELVAAWNDGRELEHYRIAGPCSPEELSPLLESRGATADEMGQRRFVLGRMLAGGSSVSLIGTGTLLVDRPSTPRMPPSFTNDRRALKL